MMATKPRFTFERMCPMKQIPWRNSSIRCPLRPQADPYVRLASGQVREDFEKFIRELPQTDRDLPSFVRNLWFAVMTAEGVKHSLSQVQGSVLMPDHSVLAHRSLTAALHGARERDQAALLYLHVGPVQSFIQASRRTDDLWTSGCKIGFSHLYRGGNRGRSSSALMHSSFQTWRSYRLPKSASSSRWWSRSHSLTPRSQTSCWPLFLSLGLRKLQRLRLLRFMRNGKQWPASLSKN